MIFSLIVEILIMVFPICKVILVKLVQAKITSLHYVRQARNNETTRC